MADRRVTDAGPVALFQGPVGQAYVAHDMTVTHHHGTPTADVPADATAGTPAGAGVGGTKAVRAGGGARGRPTAAKAAKTARAGDAPCRTVGALKAATGWARAGLALLKPIGGIVAWVSGRLPG